MSTTSAVGVRPSQDSEKGKTHDSQGGLGLWALVAIVAVAGLAWATCLRGFMAEIAGSGSGVEWVGTFAWILAPGVMVGALFGWAEYRRRGSRGSSRWMVAAPLLFAGVMVFGVVTASGGPLASLEEFLADGLGGGALGVPLFGIAGGYALAGNGRRWGRIICGVSPSFRYPSGC